MGLLLTKNSHLEELWLPVQVSGSTPEPRPGEALCSVFIDFGDFGQLGQKDVHSFTFSLFRMLQ